MFAEPLLILLVLKNHYFDPIGSFQIQIAPDKHFDACPCGYAFSYTWFSHAKFHLSICSPTKLLLTIILLLNNNITFL